MAKKRTTSTKSTPTFDAPQSRNEAILQNILGADNVLGAPQSRIEALLMQILEQGGGGGSSDAVLYTEQSLTDAQKAQARTNIGASDAPLVATYTLTIDSGTGNISSASCDKTYAEVAAAIQAKIPVEAYVVMGGVVIGKCSSVSLFTGSICFTVVDATNTSETRVIWLLHLNGLIEVGVYLIPLLSDNTPVMNGTASAGQLTACSRADHIHPTDTSRSPVVKYTTLTLATTDWLSTAGGYFCAKTVNGMTATSIVWLKYSDTETEISESQTTDTLTFGVSALPSAAITVDVAFVEGEANSR